MKTDISEACSVDAEMGLGRERREQATAWLAPFPPGPVWKECAVRVSPGDGMRGVVVTRSMFKEPITEMTFFAAISMVAMGPLYDTLVL